MSLYMNIFHGRTWDQDQKQSYLKGDGWGSQGPRLNNIHALRYQRDNLHLFYASPEQLVQASCETGWAIISMPPFGTSDNCLQTHFLDSRDDLLGCYDRELNQMVYYGDFNIEHQDHCLLKMSLKMDDLYGKGFPGHIRELTLEKITDLHFTYGTYTVWFDNETACHKARVLTGWRSGADDVSLVLPVSPIRNTVLVQSQCYDGESLLYEYFELSST
ncbi:hypothetical protein [Saezia sanguinis]|uniref:hypothetical protein n=1 Tax=Saezia sanguinis TaxID=1965230 RepID=UPI003021B96E